MNSSLNFYYRYNLTYLFYKVINSLTYTYPLSKLPLTDLDIGGETKGNAQFFLLQITEEPKEVDDLTRSRAKSETRRNQDPTLAPSV